MRWPTNVEQHQYLKQRQLANVEASKINPAEIWAAGHILHCGGRWEQQKLWGCRIFDFWCAGKHAAVEIDGKSHDFEGVRNADFHRDYYNFLRSGILVFRVPNFNEKIMAKTIVQLKLLPPWKERKIGFTRPYKEQYVTEAGLRLAHGNWKPGW